MKIIIYTSFVFYLLISYSCKTTIDSKYQLSTPFLEESKHNNDNWKSNEKDWEFSERIAKGDIQKILTDLNDIKLAENFTLSDSLASNTLEDRVNITNEIKDIFDPEKCICPLPKKVARKLKRNIDDGIYWAPKYVVTFLNNFPEVGIPLEGASVTSLMHTVTIKDMNGNERKWILAESPTFNKFDVNNYVSGTFDNFIYTLDCSGYLNAAIEASLTVPGSDIKSVAENAITTDNSMFVGGGVLISPIVSSFYGRVLGISLGKQERIAILEALINIPRIKDSDRIIIPNTYEVIWSSTSGSSGFNGKGSLSGGGTLGMGIAKISASTDIGGSISRESSFSSYNTYYTRRERLGGTNPFNIGEVKALLAELKSSSE